MTTETLPKYYRTSDAMKALGCKNTKLWELVNSGQIEARRLGRTVLISEASIKALLESLPHVQSQRV